MSSLSHRLSLGSTGKGSKKVIIAVAAVIIVAVVAVAAVKITQNNRAVESKQSYETGMSALKKGNIPDAVQRLERSVALDPKNDNAHLNLARSYASTGKVKDAENEYLESLKLNANQPEAQYNLGVIYKSQRQYDKALASFQKAKELNKNLYAADIMIAYCYRESGKPDKAIPVLEQIIKSKPFGANMSDLYTELGLAYKAQGKTELAKQQWQQALKLDPNNSRAKTLMTK